MRAAVFDSAFGARLHTHIILVEDHTIVEQLVMGHTQLHLIGDDGEVQDGPQEFHLRGGVVADPEMAHLAGLVQFIQRERMPLLPARPADRGGAAGEHPDNQSSGAASCLLQIE